MSFPTGSFGQRRFALRSRPHKLHPRSLERYNLCEHKAKLTTRIDFWQNEPNLHDEGIPRAICTWARLERGYRRKPRLSTTRFVLS